MKNMGIVWSIVVHCRIQIILLDIVIISCCWFSLLLYEEGGGITPRTEFNVYLCWQLCWQSDDCSIVEAKPFWVCIDIDEMAITCKLPIADDFWTEQKS